MAETSKNKIYYNDDENSVADVLTDMKKLAQSTDDAIEKSNYDDTQIKKDISNMKTEIAAKDNEQDNKILQLQNEKAELEKELKEAQEDFYQNSIRGQASGEYIHVEDSSNCRARIGISGNSEQETRSGKNFLELMEGTYSNNGVTAVVKDGVVTLNGTATATSFVGINLLKSIELTNNKTYHLSAFNEKTAGDGTNYCSLRINQDNIQVLFNTVNVNGSITTNLKISYITIRTAQGITYNNFVIKPQLELGNGTDTWEQGGASPSSNYQSPIKTVGSNVNLFDKNTTTDGKYISSDGSIQIQSNIMYSDYIAIEANKKYYISGRSDLSKVALYDKNKTFLEMTSTTQPNGVLNITNSNCKYIIINALLTNKDTLKIEKGNVETSYSSYNQGSVKVTKCNKNLFGKYITGIWMDVSKKLYLAISTTVGFIARVKPNTTYTIKKKNKGNRFILTAGKEPVKIGNAFSRLIFASNNDLTQYTFTTKENEYYIFLGVYNGTDENELVLAVEETQLEQNPTATNYEQHQEQSYIMPIQQPMRSIGDIRDTFIKKENKWYERHYVQRLILNGTEGWNYDKNNNRFYFAKAGNKGSGYIMSSHYLRGDTTKQNNTCEIWSSAILFRDERFTEREDFKNMIKAKYDEGIPVYVDYVSITPTDIECTEEQSQILDELTNARTYKNVTNITTDSKAILSLDYAKDLETLFNNTQALAVNNASEGV